MGLRNEEDAIEEARSQNQFHCRESFDNNNNKKKKSSPMGVNTLEAYTGFLVH